MILAVYIIILKEFHMKPYLELLGGWESISDGKIAKLVSLTTSFSGSCEIHLNHWSASIKPENTLQSRIIISKFLAHDNDFPAFWLVPYKPIIWAIVVNFDQIRKNWWRISCTEILEVGKNYDIIISVFFLLLTLFELFEYSAKKRKITALSVRPSSCWLLLYTMKMP